VTSTPWSMDNYRSKVTVETFLSPDHAKGSTIFGIT